MTTQQELYYRFMNRRRLPAALRYIGGGGKSYGFLKPSGLEHCEYIFEFFSDGQYDVSEQNLKSEKRAWQTGRCTSLRDGDFHIRQYDWYFDRAPQFVVHTPATVQHLHRTVGVAQLMDMEAEEVVDGYDERYEKLECAVVDGMNDAGLVANINVVPVGDNPNYPDGDIPAGVPIERAQNVTYGTAPGLPRMYIGYIVRVVLDNCSSVEEAVREIRRWSWYAARRAVDGFVEEFHAMISDKDETAVVEFVENAVVVHRWKSDGSYAGCDSDSMLIGGEPKPIMTNFYISKWDGDVSTISMSLPVSERNKTVTQHSQGLERYAALDSMYGAASPLDMLKAVRYRQMYVDKFGEWPSEFLAGGFTFLSEIGPEITAFFERARDFVLEEDRRDFAGYRTKNDSKKKSWHSVSSSIYDIRNRVLELRVQEDYDHKAVFAI